MRYGNLNDGRLTYAPRILRDFPLEVPDPDGGEPTVEMMTVENPTPEQYLAAGYYPIRETTRPEAQPGTHYEADYSEGNGEIVQSWVLVENEPPEPPEPTLEDAFRILTGGV